MTTAPIALFVYNRPEHTIKTVEALKNNLLADESELFIFSDGFKGDYDKTGVGEVRNYIRTVTGFKNVRIFEKDQNIGLANSIIGGISEIVNKYGKVIVMEDDLVASPHFLQYMNDALNLYETEEKVISIHGYVYPIKNLPETFFIRGADCWGWATWKRAWNLFEPDGKKLLDQLYKMELKKEFNFNNTMSYANMLRNQIAGKNSSWAIRWYASAFINDKLTLYPGHSLIRNIGLDSSGFHLGKTDVFDVELSSTPISVKPIRVEESAEARKEFEKFFRSLGPSVYTRVINKAKKIFRI